MRETLLILAVLAAAAAPAALAAQWPAGQGEGWAKLSAFHHRTTEQFRPDGERRPFLNDEAESVSSAVFLDVLVGVTDRLDLWAQVPWFHLRFDDVSDERTSSGVGDIRLSARHSLVQLRGGALPISARYTVKVPVVDFPQDAEVIPVGEGQWDHEAWLEAGLSLWPAPAYAVLWLGYRWRSRNDETTRDAVHTLFDELTKLHRAGGLVSLFEAIHMLNAVRNALTDSMVERLAIFAESMVTNMANEDMADLAGRTHLALVEAQDELAGTKSPGGLMTSLRLLSNPETQNALRFLVAVSRHLQTDEV